MMDTSKNLVSISTLLFVCLTGACASGAQNLAFQTTENADLTEMASVRASGPARAFTARARGPVRLRQKQTQGMGATAPERSTHKLRRFQPEARVSTEAASTTCQPGNGLKRFGGRTPDCRLVNSQTPTR